MSKNRNRRVTVKAQNNREYNILMKNFNAYCPICNRRCGVFDAYCGPISNKKSKNGKEYINTQWRGTQVGEGDSLLNC